MPLITAAQFEAAYKGAFAVNNASGPGPGKHSLESSLGAHDQQSDGDLRASCCIGGSSSDGLYNYAILTPPTPVIGSAVPIATPHTFGTFPSNWSAADPVDRSGIDHQGLLEIGSNWYHNIAGFYLTGGADDPHFGRNSTGLFRASGTPPAGFANYNVFHQNKTKFALSRPPVSHAGQYDLLMIGWGTPGKGTASLGMAVYRISWNGGSPIWDCRCCWPYEQAGDLVGPPHFSTVSKHVAGEYIEVTIGGITYSAVIASLSIGTGEEWYGAQTEGALYDPYNPYKGYHAEGRDRGFFVFDPAKIDDPAQINVEPEYWFSIQSRGWLNQINGFDGQPRNANPSYSLQSSFRDGRLILAAENSYRATAYTSCPLYLVFEFEAAPPASAIVGSSAGSSAMAVTFLVGTVSQLVSVMTGSATVSPAIRGQGTLYGSISAQGITSIRLQAPTSSLVCSIVGSSRLIAYPRRDTDGGRLGFLADVDGEPLLDVDGALLVYEITNLSAESAGQATAAVVIGATGSLAGTASGGSSAAAAVASEGSLIALIPGGSTVAAAVRGVAGYAGTLTGSSTTAAAIAASGRVTGLAAGVGALATLIASTGKMVAVMVGSSAGSATIGSRGALAAGITGQATLEAVLASSTSIAPRGPQTADGTATGLVAIGSPASGILAAGRATTLVAEG